MSADNWDICPKCRVEAEVGKKILQEQLETAYGNVPESEYLTLKQQASKPVNLEYTLREDYEIGIDKDGVFYVDYKGRCSVCKFGFDYHVTERIKIGG